MSFPKFAALLLLTLHLLACQNGKHATPQGYADTATEKIQLNQVGYYPDQRIQFTYAEIDARADGEDLMRSDSFYVTNLSGDSVVRTGMLGEQTDWTGLAGVIARPTETDPLPVGDYRIYIPGVGYSYPLHVADDALHTAFEGSMRGLYYQRASQELTEEHAGEWARAAGHPDTDVRYHPSSGHAEGSTSSPGGWYDAGDYNKYIVNGAFPVGQLLTLYEDIGDPAPDGSLNLPESGNGKSDYLDELKYELDWMLTMQDGDGGLHHKLTTLQFEGMVMPEAATSQRYMVGKGTAATYDFAGAAAQASRVFREYDDGYADRLLAAARVAWRWGQANPAVFYRNPEDVSTGEYGDGNADDERAWASAELFATTGEQEYYNDLQDNPPHVRFGPGVGWTAYMGNLAAFTLLRFPDRVPQEMHANLQGLVVTLADSLVLDIERNAYRQPLTEFHWGSNSDVLNAAMLIAAAHQREPKEEYVAAMRSSMNYILGNNPNGVSYLTGFGERQPMHIHHRPSAADGIDAPVPGLLSGGPNSGQQDGDDTTYKPGAAPMQSWADQTPSYASNEICLNWNAPFTYVAGFLESLR